jgi:hypothetical protein
MSTSYELIDTDDGNLIGSYDTEEEASRVVRAAFDASGAQGVQSLALLEVDRQSGAQRLLAADSDLLERVMDSAPRLTIPSPRG